MTATEMMTGPDGTDVKCYRRTVRQVRPGDYLPEHGATVTADPLEDPDGGVWLALDNGADVLVKTRRVWLHREYTAPEWMSSALEDYRAARDAREATRESSAPVPAGLVAGAAGSLAAWCQLEAEDFAAAYPAPRLADFIREAAAARRSMAA